MDLIRKYIKPWEENTFVLTRRDVTFRWLMRMIDVDWKSKIIIMLFRVVRVKYLMLYYLFFPWNYKNIFENKMFVNFHVKLLTFYKCVVRLIIIIFPEKIGKICDRKKNLSWFAMVLWLYPTFLCIFYSLANACG